MSQTPTKTLTELGIKHGMIISALVNHSGRWETAIYHKSRMYLTKGESN